MPVFNPNVSSQQLPLVEEQRAYLLDLSGGSARTFLLLTLRNDNNSIVYFTANMFGFIEQVAISWSQHSGFADWNTTH